MKTAESRVILIGKGWYNTAVPLKTGHWISLWAWKSPKIGHNLCATAGKKPQHLPWGQPLVMIEGRFWAFAGSKNEPIHAVSSRHNSVESTWIVSILPKYDMWESDNAHKLTPVIPANLFQGWKFRSKPGMIWRQTIAQETCLRRTIDWTSFDVMSLGGGEEATERQVRAKDANTSKHR